VVMDVIADRLNTSPSAALFRISPHLRQQIGFTVAAPRRKTRSLQANPPPHAVEPRAPPRLAGRSLLTPATLLIESAGRGHDAVAPVSEGVAIRRDRH
jgi:hypothetical protein